jgi:autotransporter-associated beta strand protein
MLSRFLRIAFCAVCLLAAAEPARAQRQMENLNRGLVAVKKSSTQVYLSWRLFGNDPADVAFNVYRSANGGVAVKLNATPITATTDYTDTPGSTNLANNAYAYHVRPVIGGVEQAPSEIAALPANPDQKQFYTLPLRTDTGPNGPYTVKFCWVGDLDGDGDYDFVVDRQSTLGAYEQFLEAYTNDGTFLWRMAMGPNSVYQYSIEPGSSAISIGHGDNVTVYDMDGDGLAEVLVRTSNGVVFGNGAVVSGGASDNVQFLSVVNGMTGAELARATVPNPRLGDGPMNGHMGILYLDGKRPSVIWAAKNRDSSEAFHGTITAWDWRGGVLTQRWSWEDSGAVHAPEGHQIRIADVDNDGKDEFVDIGYVLDDNGTQLFNIPEVVHGDRFHLTDIDPDRPGLENFIIQQNNSSGLATAFFDAGTGAIIRKWYSGSIVDVGRGIALDITSAHKGCEMYSTQPGIFNAKGQQIYASNVWAPEGLWWDGDLGREFIDGAGSGALNPVINKFNATTGVTDRVWTMYSDWGSYSITQAYGGRPAFWGDILGDWREELVFIQTDYSALRIYTTTNTASRRIYTLMHNPQYRCQATTKGYVQASYVDYYLGHGMSSAIQPPPMTSTDLTWSAGTTWDAGISNSWKNNAGTAATFAAGNKVLFDISGSNASPVVLTGSLAPAAVSFYNPQDFALDGTAGSLTGSMTLSKSGEGNTTLTGTHSYTGATTIWDGALVVNGQLSNSPVTVWGGTWGGAPAMGQTGGRLSGSGTVSQPVTVEYRGAIAPGAGMGSAGTLTLGAGLTANDGSVLALDLSNDPTGLVTPNDRITVNGNLVLSGTVAVRIATLNGSLPPGTYTLLTYSGALTGSLSNLDFKLPDGIPFTASLGSGALTLTVPVTRAPASLTWTGGSGGNAWDLASTMNWSRGGTPDSFVAGDSVTFDAAGTANPSVNLTTTLPVAGVVVSSENDYTLTGSGLISGSGGLVKSGGGTLTLQTTNTYTGPTTITGGTLAVDSLGDGGSPSSIGAAGTAASNLVINGGTLALAGEQTNTNRSMTLGASGGGISVPTSRSLQISGQITGAGSLTKTGGGTLTLTSANSFSGGIFISEGKVFLPSDTANVSGLGSGLVTLNGGTLSMGDNIDTTSWSTSSWSIHVPSGTAGRLNSDGRCYLTGALTGGGDFTFYTSYVRTELLGNWSAFTGRIFVIADSDGGDFRYQSSAGYPSAQLDLGANVYAYYNKTMTGNLTVPIGHLTGNALASLSGGPTSGRTLTYQVGARNEDGEYAGELNNGTGPTAFTKVGTGTLTLSGACAHSGATTVSAGRLRINGTSSASAFTVQSGGTLGGTGAITGNVTLQANAGLELNATPPAITGNLSFAGNAVIRPAAGLNPVAGTYTVLTYTGTLSGAPVLSWEPPAGSILVASFDINTAGLITVTLVEPPRLPGPITWTGANSFDWDTTTANWTANLLATGYQTGDTPNFTDAGNATSPVNITTNVSPAAVVVNSSQNYTFAGAGVIEGGASLSKSGSGTLTVSSAHAFTGGTTIHSGTITIGNASSLGTGAVTLNGGAWNTATFSPQNPILVTADSTISGGDGGGAHAVKNISGSGILTLNATSVFDIEGDVSGFSGTFSLTGVGSFRLFTTTYDGSADAVFDLGTESLIARQGGAYKIGALVGQSGSTLGMAGNNNSATCTYTIGGKNIDSTFAGVIANGSSTKKVAITKTGSGNLVLSGANTYTGNTSVSSGKLTVTGSLAATATTVASTGTLAGNGSIAGAVTCNGVLAPGPSAATLTLGNGLILSTGSVLDFELGSSSDRAAVTGNLTLDGTLNVSALTGFTAGTYTLLTYTGSLTNQTLNVGSVPPGYSAAVNTSTSGQVRLVVTATNQAPQITTSPSAGANPVTTASTGVSVTATDDAGEGNLTYTWTSTGPGPVVFSPNGNNAAKSCTATFAEPGIHTLTVTVTDGPGLSASSSVSVNVIATPATIAVSPSSTSVPVGGVRAFNAAVSDQFGDPVANPSVSWTATGAGGVVDSAGVYTGISPGGPWQVIASLPSVSNSASVSVVKADASVTLSGLNPTYDGAPKPVGVSTVPGGLACVVSYNGSPTAPTAPGSYAVSAVVDDPLYQGSASGTLVIAPRSFDSWESTRFSPAQILAGDSAPEADPDHDGLANLAEYALGADPHAFTPQPQAARDGNVISLTFQRPAHIGDVIYQVQAGSDLQTWEDLTLEVLDPGEDPETVRASKTLGAPPPSAQFLRIRVSK